MYYENVWASDCSFADMNTTKHLYFVYCFLKANKDSIDVLQKGSAQPHVYAKDINNMEVIFPSEEYLMSFKNFSSSLFEKIKVLQGQIVNLTQARDRLLPKLMSGEMEV